MAGALSPVPHPASRGDPEHGLVPGVAQGELRPKALSQRFPLARPYLPISKNQHDGGFTRGETSWKTPGPV